MENNLYNTLKVKAVCEKKLDIIFRESKHAHGWFIYKGIAVARITVSHGRKPIPPGTYKSMATQLKLSVAEFDSLLACPLTKDKYIEILVGQGIIAV